MLGVLLTVMLLINGIPATSTQPETPTETRLPSSPTVIVLPAKWTSTPTATISPTPTITPTETATPTATFPPPDPTEMTKMEKVMQQVEDQRGLLRKHNIPMYVIDNKQAEAVLQKLLDDSGYRQTVDADKRRLVILGFIKPTYDLAFYSTTRLSDNIAGFFIPEQQVLYVIGAKFGGMEKLIFSHEFDHALVFQNLFPNGDPLSDPSCNTDSQRCDAIRALVEGDASLLEDLWYNQYSSQQDRIDMYYYRTPRQPIGQDRHPPYAYYQAYFPYVEGKNFVTYVYDRGNWAGVNRVYANPPLSTEQILHPEKYVSGEKPIQVPVVDLSTVLGDSWKLETTDSLGEFVTFLLLSYGADYMSQVTDYEAYYAAAGWGGDRYQVYYRPEDGASILVAHWMWDTYKDTPEFVAPMTKYLDNRFRGGKVTGGKGSCWTVNQQTTCLYSQGRHATWIIAPDMDTVNSIFAKLDFSIP